jgi:hypothetical protein
MPDVAHKITAFASLQFLSGRRAVVALCLSSTLAACSCLLSARAQTARPAAIRVESSDVVVPVMVLDKAQLNEIHRMNPFTFVQQVNAPGSDLIESVFVRSLSASDFRVLEDGVDQRIERVTFQMSSAWGQNSTRPKAVFSDAPSLSIQMPDWPRYVVAYTQLPSPEGTCHNISVKVDRPGVLVYSQHRYCNRPDWLQDPLGGTKIGHEMQTELDSRKAGRIQLSLAAFPRFTTGAESTVDVVLEFPATERLLNDCNKPPSIEYLGAAFDKTTRAVSVRFSGLLQGDLNNASGQTSPILLPTQSTSCFFVQTSTGYDSLNLAPGKYELKMIVRDGKNFGRAEIPVTVEKADPNRLAISQIVLGKGFHKISGAEDYDYGRYEPLVSNGFEINPTTNPGFQKDGPFSFYLETYDPAQSGTSARTIEVQLQILDAKTRRVVQSVKPIAAANYAKPGDPIIPIAAGINISSLPAGSYIFEARATDSAGNSTAWRTTNFTIAQ